MPPLSRNVSKKKRVLYDRDEDQHYDTISAFIKSVRGGDPDAALYWLAKMIEAGEDPRFIARRLVILASEDIGLADPQGLVVAVAAHHAVEFIGMPEGRIPLAEATLYLACAPKSNSSVMGIGQALAAVQKKRGCPGPQTSSRRPLPRPRSSLAMARTISIATIFQEPSRPKATASKRAVFSGPRITVTKPESKRVSLNGRSCGRRILPRPDWYWPGRG